MPILNVTNVPKAAIEAISLLFEAAAIPEPVKQTRPNAKTSSNHVKFNLLVSIGWVSQILSTLNSSLRSANQRTPKKINEGSISDCKVEDNWGMKKARGPQITFAVMDREAMGEKMPILTLGSVIKLLYSSLLASHCPSPLRKTTVENRWIIANRNMTPIKGEYRMVCDMVNSAHGISDNIIGLLPCGTANCK